MCSRKTSIVCVLLLCLGLLFSSMSVLAQKADPETAGKTRTEKAAADKVNINSASAEQLQAISGIGPSMANNIIEYRTKVGKFNKIEEIMNVKGIGEKMFQKIKDRIAV
jgi:competence protein ComEA